jgi:hypothetical protein
LPHAPQFDVVAVEVSHPLAFTPSQSAQSTLQAMAQAPPVQDADPCAVPQVLPHPPQ